MISAAHYCKTLLGSSSGPAALSTFIFWSSLNTPSSPIDNSGMSFSTRVATSGRSWLLSLENTDTNWSINISALPLGSLISWPLLLRGAVILLPAHPASFAHKFLFQRVPASPGMQ